MKIFIPIPPFDRLSKKSRNFVKRFAKLPQEGQEYVAEELAKNILKHVERAKIDALRNPAKAFRNPKTTRKHPRRKR